MSSITRIDDADPRIIATTIERAKLGASIEIAGFMLALAISPATAIPTPPVVLICNAIILAVAVGLLVALRRGAVPTHAVHPVATLVWSLGPILTLTSFLITSDGKLVFPLLVELALAGVFVVSWRYLITSTTLVAAVYLALELRNSDPDSVTHGATVLALTLATLIVGRGIRRSLDAAFLREDHQLATAALLQHELLERKRAEEDRRRAEAEREGIRDQFVHAQRMEAAGTLAAGLAHDMNNIIAGILGIAEVAADEATEDNVRADLASIAREAMRAADLTRSLLAFSRRGQYRKGLVAVDAVIGEVEPLLSRMFSNRVTLERRGGADAVIDVDAAQLGQAIVNLCINGADAMGGRGTITLTTSVVELDAGAAARQRLSAGTYAAIAVTDGGCGMDDTVKKQIFEPFFTTKEVGEGTGLGLAMVYGTVRGHGGAIDVETAPGKGSTFTIYLPVSSKPAVPQPLPLRDSHRMRAVPRLVLVVDDEPVIRAIATRILRQMGLSVVGASDGAEALQVFAARRDEISLVMLDMSMPVMSGAECFRELRRNSKVPIMIVSGFANEAETQSLLGQGNTAFLEKPFSVDQMRAHVERVLGQRD